MEDPPPTCQLYEYPVKSLWMAVKMTQNSRDQNKNVRNVEELGRAFCVLLVTLRNPLLCMMLSCILTPVVLKRDRNGILRSCFQSMSPISSNIQSIILMQTEHVEISWRAFSDASLSYRQGFCLCHMAASRRRFDVLTHTIAIDCHFHCSCLKEYFAQTAHF